MESTQRGGIFDEKDVKYINPREFHRKVISDMENLGYSVPRGENEKLDVHQEIIGSKTGHVLSRIIGTKISDIEGKITWLPYKIELIVGTILGITIILLLKSDAGKFVGIVLTLACVYNLIKYRITSQFPSELNNVIRVLSQGEATERTVKKGEVDVTDLFSQLTVTFSGDQMIRVNFRKIAEDRETLGFFQKFISKRLENELMKIDRATLFVYISEAPLKEFLTENALGKFNEEKEALSETFMKLSKRIEVYGTKL